ncbi:MAG: RdgB/HAM1 family non-canonical purine NTP pyrophosphatase [Candidatus Cloacimonetes bacterium]|nr:RdgB/HAM1 family non-canonical purine NTP pyrophosphatase [Candidatus Cloacimonadota bacterium]
MKLFLATQNKDKIKEIRQLLDNLPIELISIQNFSNLPDIVEDKDTLEGNACKKALEIAKIVKMNTIADDTGFFIDALDGKPGVYAARFARENCTYADNRNKALKLLKDETNRKAYFKTVVAFASPEGIIKTFDGIAYGSITNEEIGSNNFGYDPIFRSDESGKTFGEMKDVDKNKISHRGRAFAKFIEYIKQQATH